MRTEVPVFGCVQIGSICMYKYVALLWGHCTNGTVLSILHTSNKNLLRVIGHNTAYNWETHAVSTICALESNPSLPKLFEGCGC